MTHSSFSRTVAVRPIERAEQMRHTTNLRFHLSDSYISYELNYIPASAEPNGQFAQGPFSAVVHHKHDPVGLPFLEAMKPDTPEEHNRHPEGNRTEPVMSPPENGPSPFTANQHKENGGMNPFDVNRNFTRPRPPISQFGHHQIHSETGKPVQPSPLDRPYPKPEAKNPWSKPHSNAHADHVLPQHQTSQGFTFFKPGENIPPPRPSTLGMKPAMIGKPHNGDMNYYLHKPAGGMPMIGGPLQGKPVPQMMGHVLDKVLNGDFKIMANLMHFEAIPVPKKSPSFPDYITGIPEPREIPGSNPIIGNIPQDGIVLMIPENAEFSSSTRLPAVSLEELLKEYKDTLASSFKDIKHPKSNATEPGRNQTETTTHAPVTKEPKLS